MQIIRLENFCWCMQHADADCRRSEQARARRKPGTAHVPAAKGSLSHSRVPFTPQTHSLSGVMNQRSTAANVTTASLLGSDFRAFDDRSSVALYCYLFHLLRRRALAVPMTALHIPAAVICLIHWQFQHETLDDGWGLQNRSVSEKGPTTLIHYRADHQKGKCLGTEALVNAMTMMHCIWDLHKWSSKRVRAILHLPVVAQNEC